MSRQLCPAWWLLFGLGVGVFTVRVGGIPGHPLMPCVESRLAEGRREGPRRRESQEPGGGPALGGGVRDRASGCEQRQHGGVGVGGGSTTARRVYVSNRPWEHSFGGPSSGAGLAVAWSRSADPLWAEAGHPVCRQGRRQ